MKFWQRSKYSATDVPSQYGRSFLVTGANSGIGFETARILAALGARVILACRDANKAHAASQSIYSEVPTADLTYVHLDLNSVESVQAAAASIIAEERLNVIVNNAGVMLPPVIDGQIARTQEGFESHFGVNYLNHFLLASLLVDHLAKEDFARVVTVSSLSHWLARMDFNDWNALEGYQGFQRYGMSKLANLLFHCELHRRCQNSNSHIQAVASHPGGAVTNLSRHVSERVDKLLRPMAELVINSAAGGALPIVRAATDPHANSGDFFGPARYFELKGSAVLVEASKQAQNQACGKKLWQMSEQILDVSFSI